MSEGVCLGMVFGAFCSGGPITRAEKWFFAMLCLVVPPLYGFLYAGLIKYGTAEYLRSGRRHS